MPKVVVGMSGGVDSSVAAALLKEQGYDVVGIMLRLWSEPVPEGVEEVEHITENKCCSLESMTDARRVCELLDIPFYVVNVEESFKDTVVDFFYEEYLYGRTPNPCLKCNRKIRFTSLLQRAQILGADYVATGHYARLDRDTTGKMVLRKAVDQSKDQSYVLHVLDQTQLAHVLFPLGLYSKPEVREMALERGLPVASKVESQEICFVAGNDYRSFIKRYAEREDMQEPSPGPIYDMSGRLVGQHNGLAYYTIGQRRGLGVQSSEPLHVIKLDQTNNSITVGPGSALELANFTINQTHYVSGDIPEEPFEACVRVRYKANEVPAYIEPLSDSRAKITLRTPLRSITPGQAAVLYGGKEMDEVIGGGLIEGYN